MTRISVIMPAYCSQSTIAAALQSLLIQTRLADEIVLVDSSPNEATAESVHPLAHGITYIRSHERLYPHEARNLGAARAAGDLLVFTDPDIVARPDWLAALEAAHAATGSVIVGSVDCLGRRWIDVGVHLCKFDGWLPGGANRTVEIGPSINMGVPRAAFESVGGFPADPMLGDTTLSWALAEAGQVLWFEPTAIVTHHHEQSARSLFDERYRRGREFGRIRMVRGRWTFSHVLVWLLISVVPVRLVRLMGRRFRNGAEAGWLGWFAWTWPIVLVGETGWLWGESAAYWARLRGRS